MVFTGVERHATSTDKISKRILSNNKTRHRDFSLSELTNIGRFGGITAGGYDMGERKFEQFQRSHNFLVSGTSTISDFEDPRKSIDRLRKRRRNNCSRDDNIGVIESGKSWERKAYQNSSCLSARAGGEFSGNGCDTDNNFDDFEAGSFKPQLGEFHGTAHVSSIPQNFSANYGINYECGFRMMRRRIIWAQLQQLFMN